MQDQQLLRYSRQIMLPEFDIDGQSRLLESTALIIGLGGLGSPVAMYLAAAGVGHLILVDYDEVELSNLQRQIIHHTDDLGEKKVASAQASIVALNPEIHIETFDHALEDDALLAQIQRADVVLDCTDNFTSRFAINAACVQSKTPLVSAAAIRFEAQITVFDPRDSESPCYRCLYSDAAMEAETCSQTGVFAPLLGIMGSMQALEAMKMLTSTGRTLQGRLMIFDALGSEWNTLRFKRDPGCPVCADRD